MIDPFRDMPESTKHVIDGVSIVATLGALAQWLPSIAALLTAIWTLIRIWETRTVQQLLGRDVHDG